LIVAAERSVVMQFESDVVTARAIARAVLALLEAVQVENGSVTVDHFSMNKSDGWRGDYKITVEPRT
jgi:GDP-D-mannose dehydratase